MSTYVKERVLLIDAGHDGSASAASHGSLVKIATPLDRHSWTESLISLRTAIFGGDSDVFFRIAPRALPDLHLLRFIFTFARASAVLNVRQHEELLALANGSVDGLNQLFRENKDLRGDSAYSETGVYKVICFVFVCLFCFVCFVLICFSFLVCLLNFCSTN